MFPVYVKEVAIRKAESHLQGQAELGLEGLGFFLGEVRTHNGVVYSVVEDYVTAENDSTAVSVRFSREAFEQLAGKLNGKMIIAWVHSHPGYGCFLSSTDVATQVRFFNEPHNFAVVVDPTVQESEFGGASGRLQTRFFKVERGSYFEVPFAVIK